MLYPKVHTIIATDSHPVFLQALVLCIVMATHGIVLIRKLPVPNSDQIKFAMKHTKKAL